MSSPQHPAPRHAPSHDPASDSTASDSTASDSTASDSTASDSTGGAADHQGSTPGRRRTGLLAVIAGVVLLLDVVSKVLVVAVLEGHAPVRLLGGGLYLVLVRNPGAAFSLGTGLTWLLSLIALGVIVVIVRLASRLRSAGFAVALGLVLGGALGNLVDRLLRAPGPLRGRVIDFLSLLAPDGSVWPVFNLADSAIVCGAALLVLLVATGRDYDGSRHRRRPRTAG